MKLCTMFRIISYLRRDLKENNCILITWIDTRFYILHNIFINDYSDFYDKNSLLSSQIHWCPRDVHKMLFSVPVMQQLKGFQLVIFLLKPQSFSELVKVTLVPKPNQYPPAYKKNLNIILYLTLVCVLSAVRQVFE